MLEKNTILIFDYSRYDRTKAKEIINSCGSFNIMEIDSLSAAQSFLRLLRLDMPEIPDFVEEPFVHFILIDIKFPSEDVGFDLLRMLKNNPVTNAPVIITTRASELTNRDRASVEGVTDFIEKPYSASRFEKSIKSVLTSLNKSRENLMLISLEEMGDYSIPIKSFFSREIALAKRMDYPLSIFYFYINENKITAAKEDFKDNIKEVFYNDVRKNITSTLRETDTVLVDEMGTIFIIFPGTSSQDVSYALSRINDVISPVFGKMSLNYKDYFYSASVTMPDSFNDINSFQKVMSSKIQTIMTNEKIRIIPPNIRKYANRRYQQFALWFH